MIGRDLVAVAGEALREIADDVFLQAAAGRPGVMTAFFLPANSINSLLPTIGIQISGPGFCTGRGQIATSL